MVITSTEKELVTLSVAIAFIYAMGSKNDIFIYIFVICTNYHMYIYAKKDGVHCAAIKKTPVQKNCNIFEMVQEF